MSITHPAETIRSGHGQFLRGHEQLKPFLLAVAIFALTVAIALQITGLPH